MRLAAAIVLHFGGPGSGCNPEVGKCGRPKGSGKLTQKALRERVPPEEVLNVFKEAGFKVRPVDTRGLRRMHLEGAKSAVEGWRYLEAQGGALADLVKYIRDNVTIKLEFVSSHSQGIMATSVVTGLGARPAAAEAMTFNLAFDSVHHLRAGRQRLASRPDVPAHVSTSLPAARGIEVLRETGDMGKAVREMYRVCAIHEAGHVFDASHNFAIKADLHQRAVGSDEMDLRDTVSGYALSSPYEATAEIFTAKMLGRNVAAEWDWTTNPKFGLAQA